ncbi:MAG: VanW family protein, partial [Candidatus Eremiobacteraeota bacterium]|nr:VanW family protein [Candidatus Eremiobacteraeota bacterium]
MLAFELKAAYFRSRRLVTDLRNEARRWPLTGATSGSLLAEVSTRLRGATESDDPGEAALVAGKIENLRVALRRIDGTLIPAGATFSFWRQIGRATRRAGYVEGRELREGCIVPTIGGGLCQLSNALFGAALDAGCEIVERHAHSQVVPGSEAARNRDATVFWNYVDLRFRAKQDLTVRAFLTADRLIVRFLGAPNAGFAPPAIALDEAVVPLPGRASCYGCAQNDCARHRPHAPRTGRTAFLLDGVWPEYDAYVASSAAAGDLTCVPLDGKRWRLPQYAWNVAAVTDVRQAPAQTIVRSLRSRRLCTHGAERQRAILQDAERLARHFAAHLRADVGHVVVMQNLLPWLWRSGHLGGRTFDVLMTSMPMQALHDVLDDAARHHPESTTLADF